MKKMGRLLDEMDVEKISNPHLRGLVKHLKEKLASEVDPLTLAPETAQIMPEKWHHHTDHTDYNAHQDTPPPHSDYCD